MTAPGLVAFMNKLGVRTLDVEHGWAVFILPYIEQDNVAKLYDMNSHWASAANQAARETPIPILVCPSAPGGANRFNEKTVNGVAIRAAATDYAPDNAYSTKLEGLDYVDASDNPDGVLMVNATWSIPEIADGASNTSLITECAGRPDRWRAGKMVSAKGQRDGGWADRDSEYITHGFTQDGVTEPGKCHTNCTNNNEVYSFHLGGANHVMGDGSVRFIKASMDIRLFVKLLTRSGNDVVVDN